MCLPYFFTALLSWTQYSYDMLNTTVTSWLPSSMNSHDTSHLTPIWKHKVHVPFKLHQALKQYFVIFNIGLFFQYISVISSNVKLITHNSHITSDSGENQLQTAAFAPECRDRRNRCRWDYERACKTQFTFFWIPLQATKKITVKL